MKRAFSTLIGAAAVAAMVILPSTAFAATSQNSGRVRTVKGELAVIKVDASKGAKKEALSIVTPEDLVYVLTPSQRAPKAYKQAERDASRSDFFKITGRTGKKNGMQSLSVRSITKI